MVKYVGVVIDQPRGKNIHDIIDIIRSVKVKTFKYKDKIVISYKGTTPTNIYDIKTDINIVYNQKSSTKKGYIVTKDIYEDYVLSHFEAVKDKYPDKQIELTGHSLGGNLAAHVYKNNEESISSMILWDPLGSSNYKHQFSTNNGHYKFSMDKKIKIICATEDKANNALPQISDNILHTQVDGHKLKNFKKYFYSLRAEAQNSPNDTPIQVEQHGPEDEIKLREEYRYINKENDALIQGTRLLSDNNLKIDTFIIEDKYIDHDDYII